MIWFGLAFILAIILAVAAYRDEYDLVTGVGWFFATLFFGAVAALGINALCVLLITNNTHMVESHSISGPVSVTMDNPNSVGIDQLSISVTADNRQTYTNDGRDIVFVNSDKRIMQIKDYTPGNRWLSVFNFKDDDLIIKIPASETVGLSR